MFDSELCNNKLILFNFNQKMYLYTITTNTSYVEPRMNCRALGLARQREELGQHRGGGRGVALPAAHLEVLRVQNLSGY